MRKASLFASAAVATVAFGAVPAFAQGGPFADVPSDHWAYQSVDRLQKAGIVIGYPDGTYGGKRAMTRYEFAVAIARLLDQIDERLRNVGGTGPTGNFVTREQLDQALAGKADRSALAGLATKEEVDQIRRLVTEFQNELTTLGVDVDNVKRRLSALEDRVRLLEEEMKRVVIGGSINLMGRANNRRGRTTTGVVDADGYTVTKGPGSSGTLFSDSRVLHDLDLNITARLSETATAKAKLNFGNYLSYLGAVSSFQGARSDRTASPFGTPTRFIGLPGPLRVDQSQQQTIYQLSLEAPLRLWGLGAVDLAVGRIPVQLTPWTLKLIDVDSYFYNDKTDLGDIPIDGAKGTFKLGPVGITALAGKTDPIKFVGNVGTMESGGPYGLYAGAAFSPFNQFGGGFRANSRPVKSLISPATNGAMTVEQLAGLRATFGAGSFGTIGATYLALAGFPTVTSLSPTANGFNRVYVYGADINTNFGGIGITGSYTKSDTKAAVPDPRDPQDGGEIFDRVDDDNDAWEVAAAYNAGSLGLRAGYREINPFFAAPGYWAKIGSWTNPTDIKGPFVGASYALGGNMSLAGEAHFYEGTGSTAGGLTSRDEINHYKIGLKYGLTSGSAVDLGVEWTEYDVLRAVGGRATPREMFYNIGYGFNFNPTTSFKFLYQIVDYNDQNSGFSPLGIGDGGVAAAQFSVKY